MLYISDFSSNEVTISDGTHDYVLKAEGENECFDYDTIEDILDYANRKELNK